MWPLQQLARDLLAPPPGMPAVDFSAPAGAPALFAPDSVSWAVMKSPVALLVGGIAAMILELAEPRVRTGVWEHTSFRTDPAGRIHRTGYAAMATIYAPEAPARALIESVNRRHERIAGVTPAGIAYRADDPELLTWVHATAAFGFLEAYRRFVRPLLPGDCDRFYAEGARAAVLYGVVDSPRSAQAMDALFAAMRPALERSQIVLDALAILYREPWLPIWARPLQGLSVRAAVEITPGWAREILGLGRLYDLPFGAEAIVRALGAAGERIVLDAPPAQACTRLGLRKDYLYRRTLAR